MYSENSIDKRKQIKAALLDFNTKEFYDYSIQLFQTLGYNTDTKQKMISNNYSGFKNEFSIRDGEFDELKALTSDWNKIEFLFQLQERALTEEPNIDKCSKLNTREINSYLFFGIKLSGTSYTKTQLADITREINKLFAIPVFILFKYNRHITLSIIYRRKNKIEENQDVLEKVTLIKDIDYTYPHRAHLEILADLDYNKLFDKYSPRNFIELDNAFRDILSSSKLNENFYKEITQWYYNATEVIKVSTKPIYIKDQEEHKKMFLIRLLTRLMFCWFLKEKGLINKELLELVDRSEEKNKILKYVETSEFLNSCSYYKGILQNIFFKALSKNGKKTKKDFEWTEHLHDEFNYDYLSEIPYLNGGIFNRLKEEADESVYIPNSLFYGGKTQGINKILQKYKFTVEENTPLEEDVALDPELLGLVFENLLAELDPNLDSTIIGGIRRQTGSYYTPRKVIREMVNDSLYLYLEKYFKNEGTFNEKLMRKIHKLIYNHIVDVSDAEFCENIVQALDKIRILDPACGSGAFPMETLHKLVSILNLVDKNNEIWLKKQLSNVDPYHREEFKKQIEEHLDDYSRKLGIIKNCIYGIDIQPLAVQITKLRFFISLLIEQKVDISKENCGISPMPNLETKIICANSLRDFKCDLIDKGSIEILLDKREDYYKANDDYNKKEMIVDEISNILNMSFPSFAQEVIGKNLNQNQNKEVIKEWFTRATISAPFFNMEFFYPEINKTGGFDIVIGNPPYGGMKISDEIKNELELESKEIYGAFISKYLGNGKNPTPLKDGGILNYIVSDTFMTIKSHKPLRKQMIKNKIHKMIKTSADTFKATVNTAIILCEKVENASISDNHICQMIDLTNVSFHTQYDQFIEVINKAINLKGQEIHESNEFYAIYSYSQNLIKTNNNMPFFVAYPKLFAFMNDSMNLKKEWIKVGGKITEAKIIEINNKNIKVVKLEQIADVKQGLATGDNKSYLFQNPDVRGNYRSIEDYKEYILTNDDLEIIRTNNEIRLSVIEKGISKDDKKSNRYFEGRYIIPYDKGGESSSEDGWLPNYYVPTDYFIDWSEWAINRMKTLTIAERIIENGENKKITKKNTQQIAGVFRNISFYFKKGISFSDTGFYAPTFRQGSSGVFDVMGMTLFSDSYSMEFLLGVLSSKFIKYMIKNFINHTVHTQVEGLKAVQFIVNCNDLNKTVGLVEDILENQKKYARYDYSSDQQIEIDQLIYKAYGLNNNDIEEVENWYSRRYPRLARAQKNNLYVLNNDNVEMEVV